MAVYQLTAGQHRFAFSDLGAGLCAWYAPDREGTVRNVTLPLEGANDPSYAGVALAPYAGRIRDARIEIEGEQYLLSRNSGDHQLHGGAGSPSRKPWHMTKQQEDRIVFETDAPHLLDGFPGNRHFRAEYRILSDGALQFRLSAQSDRTTLVNLSHHAYFNLSGDFTRTVLDHHFTLDCDRYYVSREDGILLGIEEVRGDMDFRSGKCLSCGMDDPQRRIGRGLDHVFLREGRQQAAAELYHAASGRRLRVLSDSPCVVAYMGGYLPQMHTAFAIEPQNHPLYPFAPEPTYLHPGEEAAFSLTWILDVQ